MPRTFADILAGFRSAADNDRDAGTLLEKPVVGNQ
jgi:hypothetical protein